MALWKGAKKKDIRNQLCTEWSTACAEGKKAMSYTGKRKDEQFLPNDEAQEQELVELKKEQQKRAAAEASASKKRAKVDSCVLLMVVVYVCDRSQLCPDSMV